MKIDPSSFPLPLAANLVRILDEEIGKTGLPAGQPLTLTFRDPGYSALKGGYHPVEIAVTGAGSILYVTDFAYIGRAPYAELVKELDFDASLGLFQHAGIEFPLEEGAELFEVWQRNFCAYYRMGVFEVQVAPV